MKKIILSLAIALSSFCSYAQWTTSGANGFNTNTGNIGIGTSSPVYKLHVVTTGNTANAATMLYGDYYGTFIGVNTTSSNYYALDVQSGTNWQATGGTSLFRVSANGNVGIGTTSPGSDLTIARNGTGVSIHTVGSGYFGTLAFNRESATGAIFNSSGNAYQINNGNGTDKNLHVQVYNGSGVNVNPDALTINGSTGGVGINTANMPNGYQFAVNGAAIATSMTVKLYNNWPDYVFNKDYRLPSLLQVKNYIDKNSHLPEMPSEQEVKDNGINLGEILKVQTKKIEELTLYAIEQQKQIDEIKKKDEARIAALEKALLILTGNQSK